MKTFRKLIFIILFISFLLIFTGCPQPPDNPPPEITEAPTLQTPVNNAEIGSNQVTTFSWTSVANATSYKVIYGTNETTVTGTSLSISISDEGYNVGDTIGWSVTAIGPVNQLTSDSRIFTIFDNEPPEITDLRFTDPTTIFDGTPIFNSSTPDSPVFTGTITDNVSVNTSSLVVKILEPNGTDKAVSPSGAPINLNASLAGTSLTGGFDTVSDPPFVNSSHYTLVVSAADDRGNTAEEVLQFAIDTEDPSAATIDSYETETFTEGIMTEIEFVSDNFTFRGTATDNVKVDEVYVQFCTTGTTTVIKEYLASGQESWTADIIDLQDGTYDVRIHVIDVVGNYYNVMINFGGTAPANSVTVDSVAPSINIIDDTIYTNHDTQATAWTLTNILDASVINEIGYGIYTGADITETVDYASGSDVTYVGGANDYSPVDIEICEPNGNVSREVIIEVGIDGVFESAFRIDTTATTCTIGADYNADVGPSRGFSTNGEEYNINLLDFPKKSATPVPDGLHTLTFRATDLAGNSTEKEVSVWTRLINRPMLDWPDDNGTAAWGSVEFQWFHPETEGYTTADATRTAHSDYVTSYYLDLSPTAPIQGNPAPYETDVVSKKMIVTGAGAGLDDYDVRGAANYDIQSENFDISADPDLGTGIYYWRIRGVIEADEEIIYEIGSDGLPFDTTATDHRQTNYYIHKITVGDIHPPTLTSPDWGEYFGTNETISIQWNDPTTGVVTSGRDGYQLQMRAISPQGPDGDWVDILGDALTGNTTYSNTNSHTVNKSSTPINDDFALYQFRIRTFETGHSPKTSGWAYGSFVYTPEDFTIDTHLASVSTGIPFQVADMDVTSDGKLVIASSTGTRIWIIGTNGQVETSIDVGIDVSHVTVDTESSPNVIYVYGGGDVRKLDENYDIVPTSTYHSTISNFIDMDYDDGNIFVLAGILGSEQLYEVSTVISDSSVQIGDLFNLQDTESNPKIPGNPIRMGVDSEHYFVILDDTMYLTRVTDTGAYVQEADLSATLTISNVDDFAVHGLDTVISDNNRAYRIAVDGVVKTPTAGYDEGEDTYNIKAATFNDTHVFIMTENASNVERVYKMTISDGVVVTNWGYTNNYIQAGGTWADGTVGLPGFIGVQDDITSPNEDAYPIEDTADNDIYVVDMGAQQIARFNTGTRSPRFTKISGIAIRPSVSTNGGVYIADESTNSIYNLDSALLPEEGPSFDETGRLDNTVFTDLTPDTLSQPKGLHLEMRLVNGETNEYLYIADYGNDRIVVLLLTQGGEQATLAYNPLENANMLNPIDVAAFDRHNVVYVLTEDNQVHLFRRWGGNDTFQYRYRWSVPGTVRSIDADQWGAVYVTTDHAIYKYGFDEWPFWSDGTYDDEKPIPLTTGLLFGGSTAGSGNDNFNTPLGIAVGLNGWDDTNKNFANALIYISDTYNQRIKVINK